MKLLGKAGAATKFLALALMKCCGAGFAMYIHTSLQKNRLRPQQYVRRQLSPTPQHWHSTGKGPVLCTDKILALKQINPYSGMINLPVYSTGTR
jgi:hypothetical protein